MRYSTELFCSTMLSACSVCKYGNARLTPVSSAPSSLELMPEPAPGGVESQRSSSASWMGKPPRQLN